MKKVVPYQLIMIVLTIVILFISINLFHKDLNYSLTIIGIISFIISMVSMFLIKNKNKELARASIIIFLAAFAFYVSNGTYLWNIGFVTMIVSSFYHDSFKTESVGTNRLVASTIFTLEFIIMAAIINSFSKLPLT